ncbi:NucA/NucB deoxyribonuclease domain-containing protein [Streptomyces microflavus]|uniref:NucA/NucB deoxyribonuclease domain-containing protein n=1 Tax=Streptomyces microflavus TaxID=1919 RepID=UPI0033A91985
MPREAVLVFAVFISLMLTLMGSTAHALDRHSEQVTRIVFSGPGGEPADPVPAEVLQKSETAQQASQRSEFKESISKYATPTLRAASDFPSYSMNLCHDAPYPTGFTYTIIDRWIWCRSGSLAAESLVCPAGATPPIGCTVVGTVKFRVGIMGLGRQGMDAADRKFRFWALLDNPTIHGAPRMSDRMSLEGVCLDRSSGASCAPGPNNGRTDSLASWMASGHVDWEFSVPESGLPSPHRKGLVDLRIIANLLGGTSSELVHRQESAVRCDSSTYMLEPVNHQTYGCGFPYVTQTWTFKAAADVKETAKHVWTAQNRPEKTRPPSQYTAMKEIPGSVASISPLERLAPKESAEHFTLHKSNRDRSIATCKKLYGAKYASHHGRRDCDEYPMASTYQGATTGDGTVDKDSNRHFSVKAIGSEDNQAAGALLNRFYLDNRILNKDKFFVDVRSASGGPYDRNDPQGVSAPAVSKSCTLRQPHVSNVQTSATPEKELLAYAKETRDGWTGGDSTYSVKLPDGRVLYLFSDTFLGPLNSDGTRPVDAKMINQSFVLKDGGNLSTLRGGPKTIPRGLMEPAAGQHWYWLGDGHVTMRGSTPWLQIIFQEYYVSGTGLWEFKVKGNYVAWFALDNLGTAFGHEPVAIEPLPSTTGVGWGAGILTAGRSGDGYTYIYGLQDAQLNKRMRVARVQGTDLTNEWEYLAPSKNAWMRGEEEAETVHTGIANEYSVTPWYGAYMLVSQSSKEAFSGQIKAWVSCSPHGPWQLETDIYRMPEPGIFGSYGSEKIFSYNAHVHDSLSAEQGPFILSYNVNTMDNRIQADADHYRDPGIYKPRFVQFSMTPMGGTRKK